MTAEDGERDVQLRLVEYCRYLYEQENQRTTYIERKASAVGLTLGGSLLSMTLTIPAPQVLALHHRDRVGGVACLVVLFVSVLMLVLSAVLVIRVHAVKRFERLCDPEVVAGSYSGGDESGLISRMIADFAVASNRNHRINDGKARALRWSLLLLVGGLSFLVAELLLLNVWAVAKGGW